MSEAWQYAGVTAVVAAVVMAAVWRPRPWQSVLLVVGPLFAALAAAASVSSGLCLTVLLVVAVAALQGLAGVAVMGLGVWILVPEQRHPTTGPWAGAANVIAAILGGLGVMIAAMFFGLAHGLRRRYDDFRMAFVVVQVLVGVLLLLPRGGSWAGPGIAWAFGTAALAMFARVSHANAV